MSTFDPAMRDLLAAIVDTLDAADHSRASHGVQAAVRSALRHGRVSVPADYLREQFAESADAWRVRSADRIALYLAKERSA